MSFNMILIQLIGAIGYISLAQSFLKKDKKQILLMQIIAYLFFAVHFYLLSGLTGAICNLIGLFALLTIYIFDKYKIKHKEIVSIFYIALIIIVNIITYQNIFTIFPMISLTIVIISFLVDNENIIRIIGFISTCCWLIYGIAYKSYISIVFQVYTLIDIIISFIKYSSFKQSKNNKENEK